MAAFGFTKNEAAFIMTVPSFFCIETIITP